VERHGSATHPTKPRGLTPRVTARKGRCRHVLLSSAGRPAVEQPIRLPVGSAPRHRSLHGVCPERHTAKKSSRHPATGDLRGMCAAQWVGRKKKSVAMHRQIARGRSATLTHPGGLRSMRVSWFSRPPAVPIHSHAGDGLSASLRRRKKPAIR